MLVFRQMGEEGFDLCDAHVCRMTFIVIENIAPDPVNVGFFSAVRIMFQANRISKLVEKFLNLMCKFS